MGFIQKSYRLRHIHVLLKVNLFLSNKTDEFIFVLKAYQMVDLKYCRSSICITIATTFTGYSSSIILYNTVVRCVMTILKFFLVAENKIE